MGVGRSSKITNYNEVSRGRHGRHAAKGGGGSIQSLCVDGLPVGEGPKADEYRVAGRNII
jgi:hypothetical protein